MAGLLRKKLPVLPSIPLVVDDADEEEDYNVEYSFAMEYHGPLLTYDIPQAVPVDVDRIPIAVAAVSASLLNDLSLPVIRPIVKSDPVSKKLPGDLGLTGSQNLGIHSEQRGEDGCDCVLLSEIDGSRVLVSVDGEGSPKRLTDGVGSSGTFGFSDSRDSRELSQSSGALEILNDREQGVCSVLSSPALSSELEVSSCKDEDCYNGSPHHVIRPSNVTSCDPDSNVCSGSGYDEVEITQERQLPRISVKKGLCYRCFKGNRFTEKEVCIVCSAKYCGRCVLRAMGSMPEGRKCLTCIGSQIDESKRGALGVCSRMLKRLLTELEIKQIMKAEILCEVNQLPSQLVCVNGKPLCQEEMVILQTCSNPPRKIKPGNYWYDKVSGFWGKEGQKPCQIISPHLNVGGSIMINASNGNTNVVINNREITRAELWMLQMAGIICEGNTHFWLSADGACQEEGQNNVRGLLWAKRRMKLVCAALSLPIPSDAAKSCGEDVNNVVNGVGQNFLAEKTLYKLLLIGPSKSGSSTLFKQAKLLYNVPFTEDERQNIKFMIQRNLYGYLGILLERREQFEEEILTGTSNGQSLDQSDPSGNTSQYDKKTIYSIGPRLKAFSDWLLKVKMSGNLEAIFPAATREYAPLVEELWKDVSIQATYNRRSELDMIPRVASYFLDRAVEISRTDYEPSDTDILYAEGITSSNGLACMEFSFPKLPQDSCVDPADQRSGRDPRFQLIRVHPRSLGENCKWSEMFEDVGMIIFCVGLSDYDQLFDDGNGVPTNKMMASKKLFESIVTHPTFSGKDFLLVLNKFDLLEEKIEQVPLTKCEWFPDFHPVISHNQHNRSNTNNNVSSSPSLPQQAFYYIAMKFKTLFHSLTGHKLFVSRVTGLESDTVDEALRFAREILNWYEAKPNFNEWSSYSIEASTTS